jgi:enterochelin esterase family protein
MRFRSRVLGALLANGPPAPDEIDRLLAEHEAPLTEGDRTVFLYRGDVRSVRLHHWIWGLPSSQPFDRIEGTDLWTLELELPRASRIEYKLEVETDDGAHLIHDPLNPRSAPDPFGGNSVLQTAGYVVPEWARPDPESRTGTLEDIEIESRVFGDTRRVTLYMPARFRRRRTYPLLIVHDGGDYLEYSSLATVLDNLIHRLEIPSMVVALTHPDQRLEEYPDNPDHAAFLNDELVPRLEAELPLADDPARRGLMGASFGAVASLAAAWRSPGRWGRLLLQSGSFAFTDVGEHTRDPVFDPVVRFVNAFRAEPRRVADRVFVSCGVYESLIYENRSLVPLLQSTGMQVRYVEGRDGHNWEAWRDRLREGLSYLFPGPLLLVYE